MVLMNFLISVHSPRRSAIPRCVGFGVGLAVWNVELAAVDVVESWCDGDVVAATYVRLIADCMVDA